MRSSLRLRLRPAAPLASLRPRPPVAFFRAPSQPVAKGALRPEPVRHVLGLQLVDPRAVGFPFSLRCRCQSPGERPPTRCGRGAGSSGCSPASGVERTVFVVRTNPDDEASPRAGPIGRPRAGRGGCRRCVSGGNARSRTPWMAAFSVLDLPILIKFDRQDARFASWRECLPRGILIPSKGGIRIPLAILFDRYGRVGRR